MPVYVPLTLPFPLSLPKCQTASTNPEASKCNIWGQCGITPDFCTVSQSATGAPGTSAPGVDGCISNCGTDIANNGAGPQQFFSVGYYEAWAAARSCLSLDVSEIPSTFTHVQFAFGSITPDYQVDLSDVQDEFNKFVTITRFKRVLSFGGWSFSTDEVRSLCSHRERK